MVYLVREFKTPQEVLAAIKSGAKLHVWQLNEGDITDTRRGIIVRGPSPKNEKWKMTVDIQDGIVVRANVAPD